MRVRDLIEDLQQRDPNAMVFVLADWSESLFAQVAEVQECRVQAKGEGWFPVKVDLRRPDHRGTFSAIYFRSELDEEFDDEEEDDEY